MSKMLSVQEAAVIVLTKAAKPLTANEITAQIMAENLWSSPGKTPIATVSARLYADIKKKGAASSFIKVAPMTFTLKSLGDAGQLKTVKNKTAGSGKHPSFIDCAERVLKAFADEKPMYYRDITDKALAKGWLVTQGKTPESTMYAQILIEIDRQQKRGEIPRFTKHSAGKIGLSEWMERGLIEQIEQHNKLVRKKLLKELLLMNPSQFETLISRLLTSMGFADVELTRLSSDGGIDVRGTLIVGEVIRTKMAVQAKRWKAGNNVHAPVVQQVRGSLGVHEQGLIITTSGFSPSAIEEAGKTDKTPIALMNGEQLVILLMHHQIGVSCSTQKLFENQPILI